MISYLERMKMIILMRTIDKYPEIKKSKKSIVLKIL
jgi:hypothetical protein